MITKPLVMCKRYLGNASHIVYDMVDCIVEHTKGAYIAGGFARDLGFGVTPKDIDIIVSKDVDVSALANKLFNKGLLKNNNLIKLGGEEMQDYPDDGRIKSVHRIEGGPFPVEFIKLNNVIQSPHEAVIDFDFNINQAFLYKDSDTGLVLVNYNDVDTLKCYSEVSDERFKKMCAKAAEKGIAINIKGLERLRRLNNHEQRVAVQPMFHDEVVIQAGVNNHDFF